MRPSKFERLKAKVPWHRSKSKAKPNNAVDSDLGGEVTHCNDKNEPTGDRWHEAFRGLSEKSQRQLEKMGANKRQPGSLKNDMDDLVKDAQQKQKQCEEKAWKFKIGDHEIIIRDYATKIITWVQKTGDLVIPFAPPQASPPWAVVKAFLQIPVQYDKQMLALLGTVEKVVKVIHHGQVYELVYTPDRTPKETLSILHDALVKLYRAALELLVYSTSLLSGSSLGSVVEAIVNPDKETDIFSDLSNKESDLASAVQACESQRSAKADDALMEQLRSIDAPLTRIDARVEAFLTIVERKESGKLLDWISPVLYTDIHNGVKGKRTPDTCMWLLEHRDFREWQESSSSAVLWLRGSPGVGKTVLTSQVIDHIQGNLENSSNHEGFAFFYCNRGEQLRTQPLSILQSFVRQLSTTSKNPFHIQASLQQICERLIVKGSKLDFDICKQKLLESLNLYPKTTLVLDALDECDESSRGQLMSSLDSFLSEAKMPVKIFIASRPDEDIRNRFLARPNIEIHAGDNQDDIERYINTRIPELAESNGALLNLQDEITTKLVSHCQGMFQWTFLQLEQLRNCKSVEAITARLGTLPQGLSDTYDEIYGQIAEGPDRELANRAFMWVMSACTPLNSKQLLAAVRIIPDQDGLHFSSPISKRSLLSLCRNLLTFDSGWGVWRVSHLSVTEYFEKKHWGLQTAHMHAAKACLHLLLETFDENRSVASKNDASESSSQPKNQDPMFDLGHPFQQYIAHHWPIHVRSQEDLDSKSLAPLVFLLKRFIGSPLQSSIHYQRWYRQILKYQEEGTPSTSAIPEGYIESLSPETTPVFGVCYLALYATLGDWWGKVNIDIEQTNAVNESLFTIAARADSQPICRYFIGRGASVDTQCKSGEYGSSLAAAAYRNNLAMVRLLVLEAGADVNLPLKSGDYGSALAAAAGAGSFDVVKFLVQNAAVDVNMQLSKGIFGSSLAAATVLNLPIVKYLVLEAGADVNMQLQHGSFGSALATAAANGSLETVKFLVHDAGADVNLSLQGGIVGSALAASCFSGSIDTAKYLILEGGAEVDKSLETGWYGSALATAAALAERDLSTMEFLIQHGANVNKPLHGGKFGSALAAAAAAGVSNSPHVIDYLVTEKGADVNMLLGNNGCGSALATAAYWGEKETLEALVGCGASVKLKLDHQRFSNALEAAEAELSPNDVRDFGYSNEDLEELKEVKAQIAEFLRNLSGNEATE